MTVGQGFHAKPPPTLRSLSAGAFPAWFPDIYRKPALKTCIALQTFFFEMSKEKHGKWKSIGSFVTSLGAGVQPRSTVQLIWLSAGYCWGTTVFGSYFSVVGFTWRVIASNEQQCQFLTRKLEFEQREQFKLSDDFWVPVCVPIRICPECSQCKQLIFSLSTFGLFGSLASCVFFFAPIWLLFF